MSINVFMISCYKYSCANPHLGFGRSVWRMLKAERPELLSDISGTWLDPSCQEEPRPEFWAYIASKWN